MTSEILALLEDGPHGAGELAAWLEHPKRLVLEQLYALESDGQVKRVGVAKSWVLASYQPRLGRTPKVRVDPRPAEAGQPAPVEPPSGFQVFDRSKLGRAPRGTPTKRTLALLAEGPQTPADLVTRFGWSDGFASRMLNELCDDDGPAVRGPKVKSPAGQWRQTFMLRGSSNEWAKPEVGVQRVPQVVERAPIPATPEPSMRPQAVRSVCVDNEEFDVVWSGKDSLLGSVDGMNSSLAGTHRYVQR